MNRKKQRSEEGRGSISKREGGRRGKKNQEEGSKERKRRTSRLTNGSTAGEE